MTRSILLVSLFANDESKTLVIPFFRTGTVGESEHFLLVFVFSLRVESKFRIFRGLCCESSANENLSSEMIKSSFKKIDDMSSELHMNSE